MKKTVQQKAASVIPIAPQAPVPESATQQAAKKLGSGSLPAPTVYDVIGFKADEEGGLLVRLLDEIQVGLTVAHASFGLEPDASEAMLLFIQHKAKAALSVAEQMQWKGMSFEQLEKPASAAPSSPTYLRERFSCSLELRESIGELGMVATAYANERGDDVAEAVGRVSKLVGIINYFVHVVEEELAAAKAVKP